MRDLAISILSSGREKTIERCLESFKPLKEALDTEIIVVNTDSTKNRDVMSVLKRYADKIIDFEWENDFSKARNVGLKAADSKWFLYVDDDEWFVDAQPIIDFLKSDECKRYHWCDIKVLNYENHELTKFGEAWVTRMIRLTDEISFVGAIHERFYPVTGDPKALEAVLGHTGYIFDSEKQKRLHFERNIRLIEQMIAKEPMQPRWWIQTVQEYGVMGDYDALRTLSEEYIGLASKTKLTSENRHYFKNITGLFIACRIMADLMQSKWEDALKAYKKFVHGDYGVVATAQLDMMGATIYLRFGRILEAHERCLSYMRNLEKFIGHENEYSGDMLYFLSETFAPTNLKIMQTVIGKVIEVEEDGRTGKDKQKA